MSATQESFKIMVFLARKDNMPIRLCPTLLIVLNLNLYVLLRAGSFFWYISAYNTETKGRVCTTNGRRWALMYTLNNLLAKNRLRQRMAHRTHTGSESLEIITLFQKCGLFVKGREGKVLLIHPGPTLNIIHVQMDLKEAWFSCTTVNDGNAWANSHLWPCTVSYEDIKVAKSQSNYNCLHCARLDKAQLIRAFEFLIPRYSLNVSQAYHAAIAVEDSTKPFLCALD